VEHLLVDAIFKSLRRHGAKEALLVAWCIASDDRKHMLHPTVGNKKSQSYWIEMAGATLARPRPVHPGSIFAQIAEDVDFCTRLRTDVYM